MPPNRLTYSFFLPPFLYLPPETISPLWLFSLPPRRQRLELCPPVFRELWFMFLSYFFGFLFKPLLQNYSMQDFLLSKICQTLTPTFCSFNPSLSPRVTSAATTTAQIPAIAIAIEFAQASGSWVCLTRPLSSLRPPQSCKTAVNLEMPLPSYGSFHRRRPLDHLTHVSLLYWAGK